MIAVCPLCGTQLPPRDHGPGRPRTYCGDRCYRAAHVARSTAARRRHAVEAWAAAATCSSEDVIAALQREQPA
jgi:hypothetical protein